MKSIEEPKIFKATNESLISIPVRFSGAAAAQNDGLIAFRNGAWHEIDTQSYQTDLKKKFPADLNIAKAIFPDYGNMIVESQLWKKNDPNCCPSGGKFVAKLAIEGNKLIVKEYKTEISKK